MKTPLEVQEMILELAEAWRGYVYAHRVCEGPELRRVHAAMRALVLMEGITTKTTTRDSEAISNGA